MQKVWRGVGGKSAGGFCKGDGARSGEECSRAQQGVMMRAESSKQRSQGARK